MQKLQFDPEKIKSSLNVCKIVKPSSKDLTIRIRGSEIHIISQNLRNLCFSTVSSINGTGDSEYKSSDFYLSADRYSVFESSLKSITLSETDKGLNIKYEDGKSSRQAQVRRRADNSRRPVLKEVFFPDFITSVNSKQFVSLLDYVSFAAQINETKSDQDMKMNQVHFYSNDNCVYSNARTYASIVKLPNINFDLSIVSSDIPNIKSFCSKINSDDVLIGFTKSVLYLSDTNKTRLFSCSLVQSEKPPLIIYSENSHNFEMTLDHSDFKDMVSWIATAVEGSSKITLRTSKINADICLEALGPTGQVSTVPCSIVKGDSLEIDIHIDKLVLAQKYTDSQKIVFRFGHPKLLNVLEITNDSENGVSARHFIKCMGSI